MEKWIIFRIALDYWEGDGNEISDTFKTTAPLKVVAKAVQHAEEESDPYIPTVTAYLEEMGYVVEELRVELITMDMDGRLDPRRDRIITKD